MVSQLKCIVDRKEENRMLRNNSKFVYTGSQLCEAANATITLHRALFANPQARKCRHF